MTKPLLIPVLSRGLPKTADAAKPATSHPTIARTQRAAVRHQSRCRSSQMMMVSIWVSLGQALMLFPQNLIPQVSPGTFPDPVNTVDPIAHRQTQKIFCCLYLSASLSASFCQQGLPSSWYKYVGKIHWHSSQQTGNRLRFSFAFLSLCWGWPWMFRRWRQVWALHSPPLS